jgi:hypothetical protein
MAKFETPQDLRNLPLRPLLDAIDAVVRASDDDIGRALKVLQRERMRFDKNCFSFRVVEYPAREKGTPRGPRRRPGRG